MNYWLFIVMYDELPEHWPKLLGSGLAAQHYPKEWANSTRNWRLLQELHKGDGIVAAFKHHRFGGYGYLASDLGRTGASLRVHQDGEPLKFQERAGIRWTAIHPDAKRPYIKCPELARQGYQIDLLHGECVRQISKRTFDKLRSLIDGAGAIPVHVRRTVTSGAPVHEVLSIPEGKRAVVKTERIERSAKARRECIKAYGYACSVCGMTFESVYGRISPPYIEVHHLKPFGGSKKERRVDPVKDLRPVCPNCHAMLHRGAPYKIETLRGMLRREKTRARRNQRVSR